MKRGVQVEEILKGVIHPEKGKDIVSLGMVSDIRTGENSVFFRLLFSRAMDPLASSIKRTCSVALAAGLGEGISVEIEEVYPVKASEYETTPPLRGVRNIIAVASGKGGVGKSTVAVNLSVALAASGYAVGLIDADIFGPSVPRMFGLLDARPVVHQEDGHDLIVPVERYGVKMLSIGFFIRQEDATVWRGPMASNFLKQMITQGDWGELDYLLVDLPPGTSDIHLTLVQEIAVTGAVIVSTPQEVALADAIKGINMFRSEKINVPVLGLVENMAWFTPAELPANRYYLFGREGVKMLAAEMQVRLLGQIPVFQAIMESGDKGVPAALQKENPCGKAYTSLAENLAEALEERQKNLPPTRKVEIKG